MMGIKRHVNFFLHVILIVLFFNILYTQGYLQLEKKVKKYTLNNGLRVLLLERHNAPVVSFITWANVGAVNEVKGITGIAHLFEHMAFKGTPTVGTKDYENELKAMAEEDRTFDAWLSEYRNGALADSAKLQELEAAHKEAVEKARRFVQSNELGEAIQLAGGSDLNAGTGYDATVYYYSLPANKAELWMSLESDRFLNPVLREFFTEKQVVMEERRMRTESRPIGKLLEEFLAAAYKAHPYGEPVVGHMSDLITLERKEAENFFKTYYIPQNLVIAIVGDIKEKEIMKMVETYWARIPSGLECKPVDTKEPPQLGQKRIEVEDMSQPIILVGYHRPDTFDKDAAVFEAITDILGQGRTSRLYKSLVKEKKIAIYTGAISGLTFGRFPGLFLFYAFPAKDHTNAECEEAIYNEIERLKNELIMEEELIAVKTRAKVNFLKNLDSNIDLAFQLAAYEMIYSDYHEMFREVEKIEAITARDIQRVTKKYFNKRNRTVATIVAPEGER
jgi:predicted Zn-dependent peptidase